MNQSVWAMEGLSDRGYGAGMVTTTHSQPAAAPAVTPDPGRVRKAIAKRSFATLATASEAGRPHVAGVLYEAVGTTLFVNTLRTSRKARNAAANPDVAVTIPIRRIPFGPPSSVLFQATVEVLDVDDPEIAGLLQAGHLKSITGHGELELPDTCFLRITPRARLFTYGLGMSLWSLIRDPLNAGGHVDLADVERS